ncbi:hypothetical protein H0H87_009360 [Tephrocybe sp. NHM501043]|nr:hypothetical protein H0H87_009360 [Tephrocybe sp. NHM501043]
MYLRRTKLLVAYLSSLHVAAWQTPIFAPSTLDSDSYTLKWPVKKVAIIGAGPGGLLNYREFTQAGFDVHLFERDYIPTGTWHYTEEIPVDAPIPNAEISVADYTPSLPPKGAKLPYEEVYYGTDSKELLRAHRGPKPIWATLHSNAPAPIQQFTELPWPRGTEWELPHAKLGRYIRSFASYHGLNSNDDNPRVSFNTRVELVEKRYDDDGEEAGWTLTLKKVFSIDENSSRAVWYTQDFDAVVIATGRYNAPNVPNIPGLEAWAKQFPDNLRHSRQYRRPEAYAGKTVLIIGGATSGVEIARDLNPHATGMYQSVRPDTADDDSSDQPRPIVTDGTHLRSLWLDLFYIEEPTLGFINMNIGSPQSFTYPEYQAVALTKVWSGKALLPSTSELWRQQRERVKELDGYGPHFQFVGSEKTERIFRFFLGWLNGAAALYGGRQVCQFISSLSFIERCSITTDRRPES